MNTRDRLIMLPPRHRIVLIPEDDRVTTLPRIDIPEQADQPPTWVVPPSGGVVQPLPSVPAGEIVDITAIMPREPANDPYPLTHLKESITVHWLGSNYSRSASDSESQAYLVQTAYAHIRKNWGSGGGNGIMYHEAIAPTGTIFVLRDYTDVVWHAGHERGNRVSRAILVMCGPDTPPTSKQMVGVRRRFVDFGVPIFRHMDWSATQCPGTDLSALVQELRSL